MSLPATDIAAVHRSDGSGTNYIFCDYLSKVSPEFKKKVGVATSVNWPVGVGGKGNEGVAGLVKQTPGAIGYVELIYALQNNIAFGDVQNHDGKFLRASLETTHRRRPPAPRRRCPRTSASRSRTRPARTPIPISSFTWMLFYENPKDKARAKIMVDFFKWALTDGQKYCADLGYAPLPKEVVALELQALGKIKL